MASWDLAQWLEALAYVVAIVGGIAGAVVFTASARRESMDVLRRGLARAWTNEGDITSNESVVVTLDLTLHDGDLLGSLSTSGEERLLEAHVDVFWGKARLQVSRLMGRSLEPVGTVRLRLLGNRNRLEWRLVGKSDRNVLPVRTVLWPSNVGLSS